MIDFGDIDKVRQELKKGPCTVPRLQNKLRLGYTRVYDAVCHLVDREEATVDDKLLVTPTALKQ